MQVGRMVTVGLRGSTQIRMWADDEEEYLRRSNRLD
jgi:hypothetical protein